MHPLLLPVELVELHLYSLMRIHCFVCLFLSSLHSLHLWTGNLTLLSFTMHSVSHSQTHQRETHERPKQVAPFQNSLNFNPPHSSRWSICRFSANLQQIHLSATKQLNATLFATPIYLWQHYNFSRRRELALKLQNFGLIILKHACWRGAVIADTRNERRAWTSPLIGKFYKF